MKCCRRKNERKGRKRERERDKKRKRKKKRIWNRLAVVESRPKDIALCTIPTNFIIIVITMERIKILVLYDNFLLYSVNNVQFPFNRPYSSVAYIRERIFCASSATILSKNGMNFKYRHWWSCLSCCQLHLLINWISSKIFANSFGISGITRKVKEWKRIFIFQYFWLEFLKIRNRMFLECFEYLEIMHLRNWKFEEIFTYLFYRKSFILV